MLRPVGRTHANLAVLTFLFAALVSLFLSFLAAPQAIAGGPGLLVVTSQEAPLPVQGTLPEALAQVLRNDPRVAALSAEIVVPTLLQGEPVVVRGAHDGDFLRLEEATLREGASGSGLLLGAQLAKRLGLAPGDSVLLAGSLSPFLATVEVQGIYEAGGPADHQAVIPLPLAEAASRSAPESVGMLRIRTDDPEGVRQRIDEVLASLGSPPPAGGPDPVGLTVLQRAKLAGLAGRELTVERGEVAAGTFVEAVFGNLTVTLVALWTVTATLAALGIAVHMARTAWDARRRMGLLASLGATPWRNRTVLAADEAPRTLIAVTLGSAAGIGAAVLAGATGRLVAFGQPIQPRFDAALLFATALGAALLAFAALVLSLEAVRRSPIEMVRGPRRPQPDPLDPEVGEWS